MGLRNEQFVFNSVLKFRRVTHFWLCLLETQVLSLVVAVTIVWWWI